MKQILEISNIVYNPEESVTTYTVTNYVLHDDAKKEVKTQQNITLSGEVKFDRIESLTKEGIEEGYEIEVVYAENGTDIGEGIQNGQTTGPVDANTQDVEANTNIESEEMKEEIEQMESETDEKKIQG